VAFLDDQAPDGNEDSPKPKAKGGYSLIYDAVRRFAQPLGIHLDKWEGRFPHRLCRTV
jgi:hypothetical protein